jgi:hypothetical protein
MKIYAVIDASGWCWGTTVQEIKVRLPQHEFVVTSKPSAAEAKRCDLIWMRGYPYLFKNAATAGRPIIWTFATGGARAGEILDRCLPYIDQAAMVVCLNESMRKMLSAAGAHNAVVIPNGVDCDRFSPTTIHPPFFHIGMAANVNAERWKNKGADVVVQACRAGGFDLVMATKPRPGGVSPAPDFDIGRIDHANMPDFYRGLSVFCQPSIAEGCSNSIMEAMACGLPCIICAESGYHGDACAAAQPGDKRGEAYFVRPGDSKAIRDIIEDVSSHPHEAQTIGRNARAFALRHTWDAIACKYATAFEAAARFVPKPKPREFHLVTFATTDYADCLRAMLPTWTANAGAASITVASDGPIDGLPVGVSVRLVMEKQNDWVAGCMAKAKAVVGLLREWRDGQRVVFLDADCAVVRNLLPFADCDEDLSLTRFTADSSQYPIHRGTAAVGAFSFTVSPRTRRFMALWLRVQEAYADAGHGIRPGKIACDQFSLTDIARGRACGVTVRSLDDHVWNSNAGGKDADWIEDIRVHQPAVLHFKGNRWKKSDLVRMAIEAAK